MNRNINKNEICAPVLRAHFEQLGISIAQASRELGFSDAYLGVSLKRGWVPDYAVRLIKARFGLDYEQYKKQTDLVIGCDPEEDDSSGQDPEQEKVIPSSFNPELLDLILEELRAIRAVLQTLTYVLK